MANWQVPGNHQGSDQSVCMAANDVIRRRRDLDATAVKVQAALYEHDAAQEAYEAARRRLEEAVNERRHFVDG